MIPCLRRGAVTILIRTRMPFTASYLGYDGSKASMKGTIRRTHDRCEEMWHPSLFLHFARKERFVAPTAKT